MIKTAKYVYWDEHSFVIFPDLMRHDEVAMTHSDNEPTGAGLITVRPDGSVRTFGESTSLRLRPGKDDAAHISAYLKGE